jgi:hypothetical protein
MSRARLLLTTVWAPALLVLYSCTTMAQEYPTKPIRWIIPYPTGGTSDFLARLIGQKLTEAWKQPVLVDNRSGANGNIGTEAAARAPADGYTLLLVASTFTMNPASTEPAVRQREGLCRRHHHPLAALSPVGAPVAAGKVREGARRARESAPGAIDYGPAVWATPTHIAGERFAAMAASN